MNLLITGAWNSADKHILEIESLGHKVLFMQNEADDLPCEYGWTEGVVCNGLFLYHPIKRFRNLKYIQITSAGFDRVPIDYVNEKGIIINNARGVYSIPMAEFAVCGVLQLYKKSTFFYENQKTHLWLKNHDLQELYLKTVCIIGCGSVGKECAKRFSAFGCRVLGIDLAPFRSEFFENINNLESLDEYISASDIIILTLPFTEKTYHIINENRITSMKDGAILINIARGAIIDINSLLKHINKLGGVVLDVFEEEPLSKDNPLWDMENIIISPHNSFVGDGNQKRLANLIIRNLEKNKI